ncbi:biliverdin-producing heme oxygenase [Thiococcus pfennigii]|uniref:biliverdin-producing heme oxygenase n=1 Tax=Thiococcus pfennigii TaxID=1057 RepID=UPI0019073BCC|nr:biliverdin-producing heme oxygenase [Thiococcus pfennigii]MBK1699799.1 hypothetical protein [Thiococcus pfennigii]
MTAPRPMRRLSAELKSATAEAHGRLERHPFAQGARLGHLRLDSYRDYLHALSILHGTLEHLLDRSDEPALRAVWQPPMARLPALESDLSQLPAQSGGTSRAMAAALEVADDLRLRAGERPVSLLGYLYVLEGSTRGAPRFRRYIEESLGPPAATAASYFAVGVGASWDERWQGFKERLDAAADPPGVREAVLAGALAAFAGLERIFGACHEPVAGSEVRIAASLNPEAGRHPITADPVELEAVLRAGKRCWRQFPYLAERFGERGKRFAASDGGWVATLVGESQADADRQLDWLAAVLAARGLPRCVMEDHLMRLYEELAAARPEQEAQYRKLKAASERLRRERFARIDEPTWQVLGTWFVARTHGLPADGPVAGQPHALAELILCAVADELAGLPSGPASFVPWLLTDAGLPSGWTNAIAELAERARAGGAA